MTYVLAVLHFAGLLTLVTGVPAVVVSMWRPMAEARILLLIAVFPLGMVAGATARAL